MNQFIERYYEEKLSLAALRSQFRAVHLESLRDRIQSHLLGWGVIGDTMCARSHYDAEQWALEMLHHLDDPVTQSFGLDTVPREIGTRLEDQARAALEHDSVTWDDSVDGVVDHDAAPCAPVETMTDDELCDYIDDSIKESENG